jgi:hypothetical protein
VPYVTRVSDDLENMISRAVTGTSWRSGGEEMEVEITPIAVNKWHIKVLSRPKSKNVLFEWGKNFENVETWLTQFNELVASGNTSLGDKS